MLLLLDVEQDTFFSVRTTTEDRCKSSVVFRWLVLCSIGFLLRIILSINSTSTPNHLFELVYDYSTGKFNRDNIAVKFHRRIWQNLTSPEDKATFLYGAYYDDRILHNGKRFVLVLAVGALTSDRPYAVMWTERGSRTNTVSLCTTRKNGAGFHSKHVRYEQFFYSCEVGKGLPIPKFVSMTFNNISLQSNLLSVHVPERKLKNKFSVCVGTSYGHIDPYRIVEWVEANKALGVTLISVYPCNMSRNNLRLFHQFEREGIMRVSRTPSPYGDENWAKQMASSPISFNDCMLRQLYSADFVIPLDFDEIITPRTKARNYESLINEINEHHGFKKSFPAYVFKMAYFLINCGLNNTGDMYMIRFTRKLPTERAEKSFVNPRKCMSVFNHFCLVFFKDFKEPRNKRIDRKFAQVNHYRIAKNRDQCQEFKKLNVIDNDFKNKFAKVILKSFRRKIKQFRNLNLL